MRARCGRSPLAASCCGYFLSPCTARRPTTGAPPTRWHAAPHSERGARVLARGAHHESERAACEHAYTDQQRGHAEDARDGWLRGQERRSRTLGVVVRVARGGRVPSRPECEHHSHLRPTHPRGLRVRDAHLACADFHVLILLISVLTLLMLVTGERVEPAESVGKPLFLSYHFPPTIFSLPMSHSHHWLAPAESVG